MPDDVALRRGCLRQVEMGGSGISDRGDIAYENLQRACGVCIWGESVLVSVVSDSATPWTVAHHAPLSMGFSR